jgi:mannitol/fructose-specific phosphotransferase system IIA component (Ntr-type)
MTLIERYYRSKASVLTLPPSKEKAIAEAVAAMAAELKLDAAEITAAVMAREKVMSTGIGQGIAIPHAKVKGLKDFAISISKASAPIDYDSLDKAPVSVLALLLSPEEKMTEHVKIIAEITKRLKFSHVRQSIMDAASAREIEKAFLQTL